LKTHPSIAPGVQNLLSSQVSHVEGREVGLLNEPEGEAMSIIDKATGRLKKAAADLTDDAKLRREGSREERKGEAKEERERAHERADKKAAEVEDLERKT
jgi:uncharacterized protein YjbJ (UPF0337 family)